MYSPNKSAISGDGYRTGSGSDRMRAFKFGTIDSRPVFKVELGIPSLPFGVLYHLFF
jgi:hypothetical protein